MDLSTTEPTLIPRQKPQKPQTVRGKLHPRPKSAPSSEFVMALKSETDQTELIVETGGLQGAPASRPVSPAGGAQESKKSKQQAKKAKRTANQLARELAELDIKNLTEKDKEQLKFLNAVDAAFKTLYDMISRESRTFHAQTYMLYKKHGAEKGGKGFICFQIDDLSKFLSTGAIRRDLLTYVTWATAEAQEKLAKQDPSAPQVSLAPQLRDLLEKYDASKEFIAQFMIAMVPLGANANQEHQAKVQMMSQSFIIRASQEDTYTDELQKLLRLRRAEAAAKRKGESDSKAMDTKEDASGSKKAETTPAAANPPAPAEPPK